MSDLMYKDTVVVTLKNTKGTPSDIEKINEPELLPFVLSQKKELRFEDIKSWLSNRSIPAFREGLEQSMELSPRSFKTYRYMSLDDSFWIRGRNSEKWNNINFFTRQYDPGMGNLLMKIYLARPNAVKEDSSPDLCTGGALRKCWRQKKDKSSYLVKAGSTVFKHEPLSEVLTSVFLEKLAMIPFARYDLCVDGVTMCSRCDNFVSPGEELVTADKLFTDDNPYNTDKSAYNQLLEVFKKFDIPRAKNFLDRLIFIDMVTGNVRRELKDIGFIYLPQEQRFKGPAPVFDNGSAFFNRNDIVRLDAKSLLFGDVEEQIYNEQAAECNNLKVLAEDKDYRRIISNFPDLTRKIVKDLIEVIDQRAEVLDRNKNIEKEKKREKVKSFAAVNITSLANINTEFNRDR